MEIVTIFVVFSLVPIAVQSERHVANNDRLARDFMHFAKRSPNIISQFDQSIPSFKKTEFPRDFTNLAKRSMDDGWPDSMLKFGDTPELLNKKNSDFDREFMNFGKRFLPFERTAMSPNKKIDADVDVNPFSREFLSFGRR